MVEIDPYNPNTNSDSIGKINDELYDEIILVSSTRERWEKLHGIDPGERIRNHRGGEENENDDDEDNIMIVTIKPTLPTSKLNTHKSMFQRTIRALHGIGDDFAWLQRTYFLFAAVVLSIVILTGVLRKKKKKVLVDTENTKIPPATITIESEGILIENTDTAREREIVIENIGIHSGTNIQGVTNTESLKLSENLAGSPECSQIASLREPKSPSMMIKSLSLNTEERDVMIEKQQQQHETLELARKFAQDVRLVQEVLVENSLDPSIAPQLAISLQSSQRIVESQRDMCYKKAMLDAHQRHLDRQLSEQQHRESLRGARYDPNWNHKLRTTRDQCYYWNASNGGVSRLWWEFVLIQQLALGVGPVWQRYFANLTSFDSIIAMGIGSHNNEISSITVSFLKDMILSVLAQACDCEPSSPMEHHNHTTNEETKSKPWIIPLIASITLSFNIDIGDVVSGFFLTIANVLGQVLPVHFQYWTCYGYCIMLATVILFFTVVLHQGLRILSLPSYFHHVVNLASMALFYGPQRTFHLILTTSMRMVMMIPTLDNHATDLNNLSDNEQEREDQNRSSLVGCSILLLSLWVIMPLLSWKRTSSLYRQATVRVAKADPADFEASFRNGTSALNQWHREQTVIRYTLLSMYSALIIWENNRMKQKI